jgi:glutamyl-tRNA reductase
VDLDETLSAVDLLLTGTGASSMLIEHADLARVMQSRRGRPLLVVDVAVPRDVDPTAGDLPGVTLLDMDDLRRFAEAGLAERRREVALVRSMVHEELDRFLAVASAREVAPLVASLREQADAVRRSEIERYRARLGELDERQVEALEGLTHAIVAKLLHQPTVGLKSAAGTPKGERLADALRDLFDL